MRFELPSVNGQHRPDVLRIQGLAEEVLNSLPADCQDAIHSTCDVVELLEETFRYATYSPLERRIRLWVGDVARHPDDEAKAIIAHEYAHAYDVECNPGEYPVDRMRELKERGQRVEQEFEAHKSTGYIPVSFVHEISWFKKEMKQLEPSKHDAEPRANAHLSEWGYADALVEAADRAKREFGCPFDFSLDGL